MFKIMGKMLEYKEELFNLSEAGDKEAQIILVFKLVYEFMDQSNAARLCSEWSNDSPICQALFYHMIGPDGRDKNRKIAYDMFMSIAMLADGTLDVHYAMYMIGNYYRHGYIFGSDSNEARKWYKMAADKGNELANVELGIYYLRIGNTDSAVLFFEQALKYYNTQAIYHIIESRLELKNPLTIYQYLIKLRKYYSGSSQLILLSRIVISNNIEWTINNHVVWRDLTYEIVSTKFGHVKKSKVIRFDQQVEMLFMISKFRHLSHLPYLKILNKLIVTTIVKHLADGW